MKILFINNRDIQCGVADYGNRVFNILNRAFDITLSYECQEGYDIILYNYHYATLPFVNDDLFKKYSKSKHICIFHEAHLRFTPDEILSTNIRPIFENLDLPEVSNGIPVIGSFGFGFPDKNYSRIAHEVKVQYKKAILRLNIPFAFYGDRDGYLAKREAEKVTAILRGSNIYLQINHEYLSHQDLLKFLSGNDLNLFLYSPSHGRGLASATDYALSVKKPVGVSDSEMFRHLPREICIDNKPLKDLTLEPLSNWYNENSNDKLIEYYSNAFKRVLC